MSDVLGGMDWKSILSECSNGDIDAKLNIFYARIVDVISCSVPLVRYSSSEFPSWFSRDLIKSVRLKRYLHWRSVVINDTESRLEFVEQRSICKRLTKIAKDNFLTRTEQELHSDPKRFWRYVNSKNLSTGIPGTMFLDSEVADNGKDIADLFASHFSSVFKQNTCDNFNCDTNLTSLFLTNIVLTRDDVVRGLSSLSDKLGAGPDGIPVIFCKRLANELSTPLLLLFNESLSSGYFPDVWKVTHITPIFKKGSRQDVTNYRQIAKLSIFAKVFDSLVEENLFLFLKRVITNFQHGFMPLRSTVTNLANYTEFIVNSLEAGCQVDSIYTDFKAAFDTIDHRLLIEKLNYYGVHGPLLSWIESYLSGRRLAVRVNNFSSFEFLATSGVPQGSHCGPLLFNIFINDLVNVINHSSVLLFADDVKIYASVGGPEDAMNLQADLYEVERWCERNGLNFSLQKCNVITFHKKNFTYYDYVLCNHSLERLSTIKDLGIYFDERLDFCYQINFVIGRASSLLGFIFRQSREFHNPDTFVTLFTSLVRPILTYACSIWAPTFDNLICKIESVQHRFLRILAFKAHQPLQFNDHDYGPIMNEFKVCSIESFMRYQDALFLFKLIRNYIDSPELLRLVQIEAPSRLLRPREHLFRLRYNSNFATNRSLIDRSSRVLNGTVSAIDTFNISFGSFKKEMRDALFSFS